MLIFYGIQILLISQRLLNGRDVVLEERDMDDEAHAFAMRAALNDLSRADVMTYFTSHGLWNLVWQHAFERKGSSSILKNDSVAAELVIGQGGLTKGDNDPPESKTMPCLAQTHVSFAETMDKKNTTTDVGAIDIQGNAIRTRSEMRVTRDILLPIPRCQIPEFADDDSDEASRHDRYGGDGHHLNSNSAEGNGDADETGSAFREKRLQRKQEKSWELEIPHIATNIENVTLTADHTRSRNRQVSTSCSMESLECTHDNLLSLDATSLMACARRRILLLRLLWQYDVSRLTDIIKERPPSSALLLEASVAKELVSTVSANGRN